MYGPTPHQNGDVMVVADHLFLDDSQHHQQHHLHHPMMPTSSSQDMLLISFDRRGQDEKQQKISSSTSTDATEVLVVNSDDDTTIASSVLEERSEAASAANNDDFTVVKKHVSFVPRVNIRFGLRVDDYSKDEFSACWMNEEEKSRMRYEIQQAVKLMQFGLHEHTSSSGSGTSVGTSGASNRDSDNFFNLVGNFLDDHIHCFRGLEARTEEGMKSKKAKRKQAVNVVLDEQERQRLLHQQQGNSSVSRTPALNHQLLASIYADCTHTCAAEARSVAISDAREARGEVPTTQDPIVQQTKRKRIRRATAPTIPSFSFGGGSSTSAAKRTSASPRSRGKTASNHARKSIIGSGGCSESAMSSNAMNQKHDLRRSLIRSSSSRTRVIPPALSTGKRNSSVHQSRRRASMNNEQQLECQPPMTLAVDEDALFLNCYGGIGSSAAATTTATTASVTDTSYLTPPPPPKHNSTGSLVWLLLKKRKKRNSLSFQSPPSLFPFSKKKQR